MAIVKNVDIKLDSNKASLSEKLFFYKGDKDIVINMAILNLQAKVVRSMSLLRLGTYSSINLGIIKPDGIKKYLRDLSVVDEHFSWIITEDLTDLLGEYKFQVDLNESTSKLTIPDCSYEILEPIAEFETIPSNSPICGDVLCGEAICGGVSQVDLFDEEVIPTSLSQSFLDRFGKENTNV
ncbi:MAG: hypothetical protein ACRCX2_36135 [Paraclostridium sp.]